MLGALDWMPEFSSCKKSYRAITSPAVSVIIPTYDRVRSTVTAVNSVLVQTFEDFELIIVDDGSTDGTAYVLSKIDDPRIRVIAHSKNMGAAAARNSGIRLARGRYVAFLDSDDTWSSHKLERQLAYMRENEGKVRLSCTAFYYGDDEAGLYETRVTQPFLSREMLLEGCRSSPGSTLLAERSLFDEVGYWNDRLQRLEDWDWLLRCSLVTPLGALGEPLATVQAPARRVGGYHKVVRAAAEIRNTIDLVTGSVGGRKEPNAASAALCNELAAAAYLEGYLVRASLHFVMGAAFSPVQQYVVARCVGRRVWRDLRRSLSAWLEPLRLRLDARPGAAIMPFRATSQPSTVPLRPIGRELTHRVQTQEAA